MKSIVWILFNNKCESLREEEIEKEVVGRERKRLAETDEVENIPTPWIPSRCFSLLVVVEL